MCRQPAVIPALLALAMAWAVGPLLPALLAGQIPGSPYTDLYPSVWGLGWFIAQQPGLPAWCTDLAAPGGMPFYYSSPIHGWVGWPVAGTARALGFDGVYWAYAFTLVTARFATVIVTFAAVRTLGAATVPAVAGALLYGASPFFHGYAVEGIVEGTDGWALPFWVWAVARPKTGAGAALLAAFALWICVLSSWYLGMVACAGAGLWGFWNRRAWGSLLGLVGSLPLLLGFAGMAGGTRPLDATVRIAMGLQPLFQAPGWDRSNPFAISTWVGVAAPILVLSAFILRFRAGERPRFLPEGALVIGVLLTLLLSTGWGPWYDLPVLRSVRFPYRWHAGTLLLLAILLARVTTRAGGVWPWLALLPWIEGYLLSPIEPVLPGSPAKVSGIYASVRGPLLLDLPGPVALPPGVVNPSRPRARYLLYAQGFHPADSPWAPDFNGVSAAPRPPWLAGFAAWEPILDNSGAPMDMEGARAAGVTQILVHVRELRGEAPLLLQALKAAGCIIEAEQDGMVLLGLPTH